MLDPSWEVRETAFAFISWLIHADSLDDTMDTIIVACTRAVMDRAPYVRAR